MLALENHPRGQYVHSTDLSVRVELFELDLFNEQRRLPPYDINASSIRTPLKNSQPARYIPSILGFRLLYETFDQIPQSDSGLRLQSADCEKHTKSFYSITSYHNTQKDKTDLHPTHQLRSRTSLDHTCTLCIPTQKRHRPQAIGFFRWHQHLAR